MTITHLIRGGVLGVLMVLRMSYCLLPASPIVATAVWLGTCATGIAVGAEAPRKLYNLPAGDAAPTLKQFAADSGEQIVYMVDNVRGEKTNSVSGEFVARE